MGRAAWELGGRPAAASRRCWRSRGRRRIAPHTAIISFVSEVRRVGLAGALLVVGLRGAVRDVLALLAAEVQLATNSNNQWLQKATVARSMKM